ncbi:sulfotransferase [Thiobacillus sp. SCN 63-57]|uniref:sulfotransferase family protein n=1 Tax=Thiobacillus sp. SCN 63-57 TaxID=1660145 RepID=UPI000B2D933E|nr:sulfotransferase [Thiobacillus sp. SCN 63-57]
MTSSFSPPSRQQGPIFIVGAPRSGTTMLQYRLRNHPHISLPTGESHFFIPLYRNLKSFGDLSQEDNIRRVLQAMHEQSRDFLETDLHGLKFDVDRLARELHTEGRYTMPAIISGLFEKNARGEGKSRWGDKTPYYVMHLPKLLEWFPDAQIVHLIRDGRDVALSLFGRQHDFSVYNTYFAAEYWESYVEKGRALGSQLPPQQYMELRYEDLLAHPEDSMQRICTFLGEPYSAELFAVTSVDDPGKTPLVHEPLKADNAGKWRSKMTPAQIRAFESVAGKTLREFGYDLVTPGMPPALAVKAAYRLHNKVLTRFWKRTRRALA